MSNSPYILVLDCDMYANNPASARQAMCFHLDPHLSPSLAFVQFPQNFHNISKNDIYCAELRSVFKVGVSSQVECSACALLKDFDNKESDFLCRFNGRVVMGSRGQYSPAQASTSKEMHCMVPNQTKSQQEKVISDILMEISLDDYRSLHVSITPH